MCAAGEILGAFLVPAATKYSRKSWVFGRLAPFGRENTLKKLGFGALMVPPAQRKMYKVGVLSVCGACGTEIQSEFLGFRPFGVLRGLEYTQKAEFRGIDGASGTKIQSKNKVIGGFAPCGRTVLGSARPAGAFFLFFPSFSLLLFPFWWLSPHRIKAFFTTD
jgi:hypothetical protein